MATNLLLVIVDCLRYDRVTPHMMPFLYEYGRNGTSYTNYWSSSHCTDPAVTHMLSGRHPDDLQLYSMMFEHKDYTIPESVEMLPQLATKLGYDTGFVTNIRRWYKRGVKHFVDCRFWPGTKIFQAGKHLIETMQEPWFLIVHTDDCHTNYTNGSYDNACRAVDGYLKDMLSVVPENSVVFINADHGEGLGEKGIQQHGFGLWDFLTHVPLICNCETEVDGERVVDYDVLLDPGALYQMMRGVITNEFTDDFVPEYVIQAGDTPPDIRHRGVVYPDGSQFIRETRGDIYTGRDVIPQDKGHWAKLIQMYDPPDIVLEKHCAKHGIRYDQEEMPIEVLRRLEGLGYVGFH